ncbi:MAG: S8 family serine peptidase [Lentisphaerales bacterium]|nr:S8 family serine peptidase [Lentisphaerales bacterium]
MSLTKTLTATATCLLSCILIYDHQTVEFEAYQSETRQPKTTKIVLSTKKSTSSVDLPAFTKLDNLKSIEVLDQRLTSKPSGSKVDYIRETLVKTNLKYPYLKIKESFIHNPLTDELEEKEALIYSANQLIVSHMSTNSSTSDDFSEEQIFEVAENVFLVSLNEATLDSVDDAIASKAGNPAYHFVEPNYLKSIGSVIPNDSNFSSLWGMNNSNDVDIDAPEAWQIQTGSSEVVVGVIDTGVSYTHPDLNDNIWTNEGETGTDANGKDKATNGIDDDGNGYIDDVYGWDFYNNDNDPDDDNGHGTHCAGTIGAEGNNNIGVTGVTWDVKIMPLKFLGGNGSGYLSDAIAAIEYATNMGAEMTSNSWGGGGYSNAMHSVIADAENNDILFIAAAGNSRLNSDTSPQYPAAYNLSNIISVAAVDRYGNLASFSNYGKSSVDLGAPGVSIYSTWINNGYRSISGTSMACPHVSGAAALLLSSKPNASASEVKSLLLSNTHSLASLTGKTITGGFLNINNSIRALADNDDTTYKAADLLSPTNGADLSGSEVVFSWNEGQNINNYELLVGSTLGGSEYYNHLGSELSISVQGLPTDGSVIYVRLISHTDASTLQNDYSFTAFESLLPPLASKLTSPSSGTRIMSGTTTFKLDDGHRINYNWIYIGTSRGSHNYYGGPAYNGSISVNMTIRSKYVYVRAWSYTEENKWIYKDYRFRSNRTSTNASYSQITSPVSGSIIKQNRKINVRWANAQNVQRTYLSVKTKKGFAYRGYVSGTRKSVKIPKDAGYVKIRLYSRINGRWKSQTKTYEVH